MIESIVINHGHMMMIVMIMMMIYYCSSFSFLWKFLVQNIYHSVVLIYYLCYCHENCEMEFEEKSLSFFVTWFEVMDLFFGWDWLDVWELSVDSEAFFIIHLGKISNFTEIFERRAKRDQRASYFGKYFTVSPEFDARLEKMKFWSTQLGKLSNLIK